MATPTRALYALLGATALLGAAATPGPNPPPRPAVPVEQQLRGGGADVPFDPALAAPGWSMPQRGQTAARLGD